MKKKGTSIIFVNRRREVLLVLRDDRSDIPFPNYWDILGGHVEEGETPEECICREMKEEIGVVVRRPDLFRTYELPERLDYVFWQAADFDLSEIELCEGQRLKWFAEAEIRAMGDDSIAFGFHKVLLEFFEERPFEK
jgi:8-oxo-dGTP diphosphatase